MYAVIKTGGKQYRVSEGDVISIEKLAGSQGDEVVFAQVLLVGEGDQVHIGRPHLAEARVTGEIVSQYKGPKINVFKMKRRKGYKKKTGHRQELTRAKINRISI